MGVTVWGCRDARWLVAGTLGMLGILDRLRGVHCSTSGRDSSLLAVNPLIGSTTKPLYFK